MSKVITNEVVRSTCGICPVGCGVLIHLENGRAVKIEGDPENPVNEGILCVKGMASLEYLYHPDRLNYPVKRVGKRGEGKWQRISWDEALNTIASELVKSRSNYGAESVGLIHGAAKGIQDSYLVRLGNAFGTPNVAWHGHVCHVPRTFASSITYGFHSIADLEYPPALSIVWGINLLETRIGEHKALIRALDRGTKLILIDPRQIGLAERADLWLQPRPGSDLALALDDKCNSK